MRRDPVVIEVGAKKFIFFIGADNIEAPYTFMLYRIFYDTDNTLVSTSTQLETTETDSEPSTLNYDPDS